MTSASDPDEPKRKKPGPKPERLVIDPEEAEDVLDHLLRKGKGGEEDPAEEPEEEPRPE